MKLVILDRDGVINFDSDVFIKSPAEWTAIPGSLEAIVRLKHAGLRVAIASNQSGLGRGLFEYDALFAIHDKMARQLADLGVALDGVFFCPHLPDAGCDCRKPATGMIRDILHRWNVSVDEAVMIGNSARDIAAAKTAGLRPLGVRSGKSIDTGDPVWEGVAIHDDLASTADRLLTAS